MGRQQEDGYPQPLTRVTEVRCPAIADTVYGTRNATARLRAQNLIKDSGSQVRATLVTLINTGDTDITGKLVEADSDNPSSGRSDLGTAMAVKAGGQVSQTVYPNKEFVEFRTTSGEGEVRMQLTSRLRWNELGFQIKGYGPDPFYPLRLWQPTNLSSWSDVNK